MSDQFEKRLKRTLILSAIAFVVGIVAAYIQISDLKDSARNKLPPPPVAGASVGGPFELIDHNGETVTQDNYAGKAKLIYFGFTYCPAICPTELQKITKVLKQMGKEAREIQPLFITIDPERDTPDVMQEYVKLFDPRLVGLTGSQEQIDEVLENYKVFAKKVQTAENNDYTMDHSSFIYLMSADDQLISIYRIKDDANYIIADIRAKL